MLYPSVMYGLGMLKPIASVNQIQVDISIHREDLSHRYKIHNVDNSKRTLEYIDNTEPVHLWYNYVIVNNIPEVPEDIFTRLIQYITANRYQGRGTINPQQG